MKAKATSPLAQMIKVGRPPAGKHSMKKTKNAEISMMRARHGKPAPVKCYTLLNLKKLGI